MVMAESRERLGIAFKLGSLNLSLFVAA